VTEYEAWSLTTQWITAGAAVAAIFVAVVFGALTLRSSNRSKDAQERATFAAADKAGPLSAEFAQAVAEVGLVNWEVLPDSGENWLLRNSGSSTAYDVSIVGLTELDKKRLTAGEYGVVAPTGVVQFRMVSRFTISGPGNIVVTFRLAEDGAVSQRTVRVPAP
jgi:hypothetical protein